MFSGDAYPDVRLLGPCSFEGTRITRHSFSLTYLNPPFDDQFGAGGREEVAFLRHAVDLLVLSQDVKAIRAALVAGINAPIWLRDVSLAKDGEPKVPGPVSSSPGGYRIDAHKLGFGSIHALFTCHQQGFLSNDSNDALWQELKQERFTTPLLRGWLPYVRKELELKSLLVRCHTLDSTCCILSATSADLDVIVEAGLKSGSISIQKEAA